MVKKTKESTKVKPLSHLDRILENFNIDGYILCISQESYNPYVPICFIEIVRILDKANI